jgi:membrane protein insertase Oxa1/YidC/SpoIIIJ
MLQVGLFAMHVLEVMFFVGMAGSAIVVLTIAVRMMINGLTVRT